MCNKFKNKIIITSTHLYTKLYFKIFFQIISGKFTYFLLNFVTNLFSSKQGYYKASILQEINLKVSGFVDFIKKIEKKCNFKLKI